MRRTSPTLNRLILTLALVLIGFLWAKVTGITGLADSHGYRDLSILLLAIGLYSSTNGIGLREARREFGTVLIAVTVGVIVKAAFITLVMLAVFRKPEYLVLGIAVAQIDPLSVAAMRTHSRMSERVKTIILAWASFDDPVTSLLTVYMAALTVSLLPPGRITGAALPGDGDLAGVAIGLAQNLAFAAAALVIWLVYRASRRWLDRRRPRGTARVREAVAIALLTALFAVAVWRFWMLGLALAGLFFRPRLGRTLDRLTTTALAFALFALGMLLPGGIDVVPGLVLGVAAFVAQVGAGLVIGRRQLYGDRVRIALAQQNGITAVILALLLESVIPHTIAVVAPAILVINLLHVVTNAAWERFEARSTRRVPLAEPAPVSATARTGGKT